MKIRLGWGIIRVRIHVVFRVWEQRLGRVARMKEFTRPKRRLGRIGPVWFMCELQYKPYELIDTIHVIHVVVHCVSKHESPIT